MAATGSATPRPPTGPGPTRWNHTPPLPIRNAPFLPGPFEPRRVPGHMLRSWKPNTARVLMIVVAAVIAQWFSPSMTDAASFAPGWIAQIWVRNVVLVLAAAGLPHLWLFVVRGQGDELRYDNRPLGRNKRLFLFNNQVLDNAFLSLVPATIIGSLWESVAWWAYANDVAPMITFASNPIWFVALLVIIPWWSVLYFSAGHWLLHRGAAYRHVHSWHHRNVNLGPWSGLAMHPAEHVVLYGDVLLFLLLPSAPVHLLFAMMHHTLGAPLSHTGFDRIDVGPIRLQVGDFHHQLHHRFIECNYGGAESPLDDLLDAWHDGTPAGDEKIAERRRMLNASRR